MNAVDVVKYETSERELVGKFASDNIRLGSQLVVYPGQTAFFVKGGKIYDAYTSGTYTLNTENIPLLGKVLNLPFGGDTPFSAEVWFVNQLSLLDCKWGTATPLQIEDPEYKVIVPLRAYGQYGFHIDDPRLFLERLVGNMPSFATGKVVEYFKGVILSKLTSIVYDKLKEDGLSVLNINAQIESLSDYAERRLAEEFARYGLAIELFRIVNITVKEDDPSFKLLKEAKDAAARIPDYGQGELPNAAFVRRIRKSSGERGRRCRGCRHGLGCRLRHRRPGGADGSAHDESLSRRGAPAAGDELLLGHWRHPARGAADEGERSGQDKERRGRRELLSVEERHAGLAAAERGGRVPRAV